MLTAACVCTAMHSVWPHTWGTQSSALDGSASLLGSDVNRAQHCWQPRNDAPCTVQNVWAVLFDDVETPRRVSRVHCSTCSTVCPCTCLPGSADALPVPHAHSLSSDHQQQRCRGAASPTGTASPLLQTATLGEHATAQAVQMNRAAPLLQLSSTRQYMHGRQCVPAPKEQGGRPTSCEHSTGVIT